MAAGSSSQASFVAYVADSKDAVIEEVSRLYYSLLGRRPFGSLHADVVAIQYRHLHARVQAEQLYASGEYVARGGTTASWVTAVYRSILGRVPSPGLVAERQAQVASHGRQYVATVLYSALEARTDGCRASTCVSCTVRRPAAAWRTGKPSTPPRAATPPWPRAWPTPRSTPSWRSTAPPSSSAGRT